MSGTSLSQNPSLGRPVHSWLQRVSIAYVPGPVTPLLGGLMEGLLDRFHHSGHAVLAHPADHPGAEVLLTTAGFGEPVSWREALFMTARRRFHLERHPTVFTLLHAHPGRWQRLLDALKRALAKDKPDPADFAFPGLSKQAYHTLYEQGRRGGPLMAAVRIIQAQSMSIRNILVVGEDAPQYAYTFDLVGAHPRSSGNGAAFYDDLMYRILTAASTHEITQHEINPDPIPRALWQQLAAPQAMLEAGRVLGKLGFFTEMVKVANLVDVPLLDAAIASQYSEGCFATWEPGIEALVCTITGSARPVEKDNLGPDDLAVITGVRPDGLGACVRPVEGLRNDPPSSEAVEMIGMDADLPKVNLPGEADAPQVPVARSKLHGHRSVRSFDSARVEFVALDPPYYTYPVSCSTEAQAGAIRGAFARSQALQNPADPRQVVFTVLPGHGLLAVEKWVPGKVPLQVLCEAIASGQLEIENDVPQGRIEYATDGAGRMLKRVFE